jgi:hypothetical protein
MKTAYILGLGAAAFVLYQMNKKPITAGAGVGPSRSRREEDEAICCGRNSEEISVDYPTFTGGTYIHPEFLPEMRQARIQGGRFIHPSYLPPERRYSLQSESKDRDDIRSETGKGAAHTEPLPEFNFYPLS